MKSPSDYLREALRSQEQLNLFNKVVTASDVEIKFEPKMKGAILKIRAKSVNPDYVFTIDIADINMSDISGSLNVKF